MPFSHTSPRMRHVYFKLKGSRMRTMLSLVCGLIFACFASQSVATEDAARSLSIRWTKLAMERDYLSAKEDAIESAFDDLNRYVANALLLENDLTFVISAETGKYYAPETREIHVPLSAFYRIIEGSRAKYPQQTSVQEGIIFESLKHLFFSEFANAMVQELSIPITGWDRERIDSFALLSQLHKRGNEEHLFILDASEEYLLVDRWRPVLDASQFSSEFAADEFRYGRMACLVQGFEAHYAIAELQGNEACLDSYLREIEFWRVALEGHLRPNSPIKEWAKAPS